MATMNKYVYSMLVQVISLLVIYWLYCGSASFINIIVVAFIAEIMVRLKSVNLYLLRFIHLSVLFLLSFFIYMIFIVPCSKNYIAEILLFIYVLAFYIRVKKDE